LSHRILIIDDDEHICNIVRITLEAQGYEVKAELEGNTGLQRALNEEFQVIILDIMLPEKDGWEICKEIRNSPRRDVPIIMLTAKTEEVDRVLGLELGADDYLTKPFSPRELTARVKALLRRTETFKPGQSEFKEGELEIDLDSHKAYINGEELLLTPKEFELLALLIRQKNKAFSRKEILQRIWDYNTPVESTRTVDEHIKRLRHKIDSKNANHSYIQTVRGVGYKFEVVSK